MNALLLVLVDRFDLMLPEETDAFDSLFLPDGVTVPEPAEEREPALGG